MKKVLAAIGDSITWGTYTSDTDTGPNSFAEKPFAALVAETLGYDEFINLGMNGTSVSSTAKVFPEHAMSLRIDKAPSADLLLVAAGTNDYGGGIFLGSPEDREEGSFYGALDVFFRKIKAKYEKVYVITPIPRLDDGENSAGFTLADYVQAIELRAEEYGLPTIDGSKVPIDPKTKEGRSLHIRDGLHPNPEGHRIYAEYVVKEIEKLEK